jgi:regulation of enolase protein 1 (concanavalin A-like superfamily)
MENATMGVKVGRQNLFQAWKNEQLDNNWWWLREDPQAWSLKNHALHLKTLHGSLWGKSNNAKNILLRPKTSVVSGLTLEVTVTNQPVLQGEQAGLILYIDEANYIKLVKECLDETQWIVLAREQDDNPALVAKIPCATESAQLRLTITGSMVEGWVCMPGTESWIKVGECALLIEDSAHPGVFTHGGAEEAERWVTLRDFYIYIE